MNTEAFNIQKKHHKFIIKATYMYMKNKPIFKSVFAENIHIHSNQNIGLSNHEQTLRTYFLNCINKRKDPVCSQFQKLLLFT